jgi:hypothetical protein
MTLAVSIAQSGSNNVTFRNRIINGGMVIDQRNAGASVTATNSAPYTLDRWFAYSTPTSKFTVQQNAGSVTPPTGFSYYLGCTSSSAYSIGSGDLMAISQRVEGFNSADLAWGTASAATVTLSFWVRSSLTGTFGGSLQNSDQNYSYPFSYTISTANTWEYKTITITGPTAGTWVGATNGTGIKLWISLGAGSTNSGTAGSWSANGYFSATGATSVVGTSSATFYITGVQLEAGTTASLFENRQYGTELNLCQRYYEKSYDQAQAPASFSSVIAMRTSVVAFGGNEYGNVVTFKVSKRATPTMTFYTNQAATSGIWVALPAAANRTVTASEIGENSFSIVCAGTSTDGSLQGTFTASAEL